MEWSNLNIGIIIAFVLGSERLILWLIKYFNKAYRIKKGKDDLDRRIDTHGEDIKDVKIKINEINNLISGLLEIFKTQIRYDIVQTCEDSIEKGYIEQYRLQSLEDLYTVYSGNILKGNSYASTMMKKCRQLPIHKEREESL